MLKRMAALAVGVCLSACSTGAPESVATADRSGYEDLALRLPWSMGDQTGAMTASVGIPFVLHVKRTAHDGQTDLCAYLTTTATDSQARQILNAWKDGAQLVAGGEPVSSLKFVGPVGADPRCTTVARSATGQLALRDTKTFVRVLNP
jgi:hypothetical protein